MVLLKTYRKHILVAVLLAGVMVPFLMLAFFAFPSNDDFSYSVMMSSDVSELFTWGAVKAAVSWVIQSGNPLIAVINYLVPPMRYFGVVGLRILVFLCRAVFLFSGFVFVKWVLKGIFKRTQALSWMIAYLLYITGPIAFFYQAEIFAWGVCVTGYLLPLSCLHLGLAFWIRASQNSQKRLWVISGLFGIIGSMAPMNVAALVCGLYVTSFLLQIMNRKDYQWAAVITLAVIAVGIVPLSFPGTWARHAGSSVHQDLWATLTVEVTAFGASLKQIVCSPVALILCVSGFLAFKWASPSQKLPWPNLVILALVAVLGPMIAMFPHFFGYGSSYYPPRAQFVMDFTVVLGLLGLIVGICIFVKSRVGDVSITKRQAVALPIVFVLLFASIAGTYDWKGFLPLKVAHDVADGKLMRTHAYWTDALAKWEGSQGQDVKVILEDHYGYQMPYLVYPFIHYQPEHWTNQHMAEYYHMNSIAIQYYHDYVKGE